MWKPVDAHGRAPLRPPPKRSPGTRFGALRPLTGQKTWVRAVPVVSHAASPTVKSSKANTVIYSSIGGGKRPAEGGVPIRRASGILHDAGPFCGSLPRVPTLGD